MSTIDEQYSSDGEFTDLLIDAAENARTGWEEDFVSDMEDKFERYGGEMYLSDKQREILERIRG